MDRRRFLAALPLAAAVTGLGSALLRPGIALAQDAPEIAEMVLGNPDAPVEVIEYASFTCPHCARFHESVFPQLKENYIDTGRIRFVNREVFFDRYGLWASMVARCGGSERYFGIAGLIYERQREWLSGDSPAAIADNLRRIGRTAGLTAEELEACLTDAEMARALVARYERQSAEHGITSTPSFVIDGTKYGNMSYEDFAAIIDKRLGA